MPRTDVTAKLPPEIELALKTRRPKLLREIAEDAAVAFAKLDDQDKVYVLKKALVAMADVIENSEANAKLIEMYEEMYRSVRSASEDLESCCDEIRERSLSISKEHGT